MGYNGSCINLGGDFAPVQYPPLIKFKDSIFLSNRYKTPLEFDVMLWPVNYLSIS